MDVGGAVAADDVGEEALAEREGLRDAELERVRVARGVDRREAHERGQRAAAHDERAVERPGRARTRARRVHGDAREAVREGAHDERRLRRARLERARPGRAVLGPHDEHRRAAHEPRLVLVPARGRHQRRHVVHDLRRKVRVVRRPRPVRALPVQTSRVSGMSRNIH